MLAPVCFVALGSTEHGAPPSGGARWWSALRPSKRRSSQETGWDTMPGARGHQAGVRGHAQRRPAAGDAQAAFQPPRKQPAGRTSPRRCSEQRCPVGRFCSRVVHRQARAAARSALKTGARSASAPAEHGPTGTWKHPNRSQRRRQRRGLRRRRRRGRRQRRERRERPEWQQRWPAVAFPRRQRH